MKLYYHNGYLNGLRDFEEVSDLFIQGNSLLHNGSFNVLSELSINEEVNFEIGIVPYPLASDMSVSLYT